MNPTLANVKRSDADCATRLEANDLALVLDKHPAPLVRINAPDLFALPAWRAWLNDPRYGPATWHKGGGGEPSEYSDVFTYYGGAHVTPEGELVYEGSDTPQGDGTAALPEAALPLLAAAVEAATGSMGTEAVLWISNLPD